MGKEVAVIRTGVAIIGSGGAGLRAAIELDRHGIPCLVVGKCRHGDAHTVLAAGGINAALGTMDPQDTWRVHAADTLKEGLLINDPRLVEKLTRNAPGAIKELVGWGASFHREPDGRLTQRFFGAHTYRRTCFVGDRTGREIEQVLLRETIRRKIPHKDNFFITHLLKARGRVNGCLGIDTRTGKAEAIETRAVVLCTGGYSRCYRRSTSRMFENVGEGIGLAYDAGAELQDMEMVQFHPTGMVWPPEVEGMLVSEAVRGEGGILLNAKGERFMGRYDERLELGPRDVVARANYREILAGRGTKHEGVWLDITKRPKEYIMKRLPGAYEAYKRLGIDISKERMEVAPTAHYTMGGIRFDGKSYHTNVPGLWAIGEATAAVHGANRLGGNSLAEIVVFGRLISERIAGEARKARASPLDRAAVHAAAEDLAGLRRRTAGADPINLKTELQTMMWRKAGILRTGKELREGLRALEGIRKRAARVRSASIRDMTAALELRGMLVSCEAILRSALQRTESRGAHYRTDHERTSRRWLRNILCAKTNQGMRLLTAPVPAISATVRAELRRKRKATHHLLE